MKEIFFRDKNVLLISPEHWTHLFISKHHYAIELAKAVEAKIDVVNVYNLPVIDATNLPAGYVEQMLDENYLMGMPAWIQEYFFQWS